MMDVIPPYIGYDSSPLWGIVFLFWCHFRIPGDSKWQMFVLIPFPPDRIPLFYSSHLQYGGKETVCCRYGN